MNRCYDRFGELLKIRDYRERKEAIETYVGQVTHLPRTFQDHLDLLVQLGDEQARAGALGELFGAMLLHICAIPAWISDTEQKLIQLADLIDIACNLAAWRAQHGDYPDLLEQLVPRHLQQVPVDHFSGGELIYRKFDGGYLLSSVGPNGTNDSAEDVDGRWHHLDDVYLLVTPPEKREP